MHGMKTKKLLFAFFLVIAAFPLSSFAQGLNWEGQTGAFLTPFAYTANSPGKFGRPELAFHYLNAGNVIGNDYQLSITEGVARHFELGYTGAFSSSGNAGFGDGNYLPSYLFANGFSEFHGKLKFINENARGMKWVPAIAVGALGRTGVQRVGGVIAYQAAVLAQAPAAFTGSSTTTNGDFYIVATKTIPLKRLPFLLSIGEKVTNASILGIAGNASHWQGRLFGAFAFVVKAPAKIALVFGSEALQSRVRSRV